MRPYSLPYYSHDCKRSQHNTVAFIFYSQSRHIAFTVTGTKVLVAYTALCDPCPVRELFLAHASFLEQLENPLWYRHILFSSTSVLLFQFPLCLLFVMDIRLLLYSRLNIFLKQNIYLLLFYMRSNHLSIRIYSFIKISWCLTPRCAIRFFRRVISLWASTCSPDNALISA